MRLRVLSTVAAVIASTAMASAGILIGSVPSEIDMILGQAQTTCNAEADPSAPPPVLRVENAAVTWLDLDGDDAADDAVVDFNHIACPVNLTLWHGSAGGVVHLVVDNDKSAAWSGYRWRLVEFSGRPLVLLGRHGGACDGYGAQPCVQAISVTDGGFSTVVLPEPNGPDQ